MRDKERGVIWEECIILLPKAVSLSPAAALFSRRAPLLGTIFILVRGRTGALCLSLGDRPQWRPVRRLGRRHARRPLPPHLHDSPADAARALGVPSGRRRAAHARRRQGDLPRRRLRRRLRRARRRRRPRRRCSDGLEIQSRAGEAASPAGWHGEHACDRLLLLAQGVRGSGHLRQGGRHAARREARGGSSRLQRRHRNPLLRGSSHKPGGPCPQLHAHALPSATVPFCRTALESLRRA